jgi:hypothetical protein
MMMRDAPGDDRASQQRGGGERNRRCAPETSGAMW